jgi:hypothetical protein
MKDYVGSSRKLVISGMKSKKTEIILQEEGR